MVDEALIYSAKMAGRITTKYYDVEVERLLNAAMLDLGVAGVVIPSEVDDLVRQAAITYFLMNFGASITIDCCPIAEHITHVAFGSAALISFKA